MNLSFGGVLPGIRTTSHYVNIVAGMQAFFGRNIMYTDSLPPQTMSFPTLSALTRQLEAGAIGHGVHVHVGTGTDMGNVNYHLQMSPTILAALRINSTPIMQMPLVHFD